MDEFDGSYDRLIIETKKSILTFAFDASVPVLPFFFRLIIFVRPGDKIRACKFHLLLSMLYGKNDLGPRLAIGRRDKWLTTPLLGLGIG